MVKVTYWLAVLDISDNWWCYICSHYRVYSQTNRDVNVTMVERKRRKVMVPYKTPRGAEGEDQQEWRNLDQLIIKDRVLTPDRCELIHAEYLKLQEIEVYHPPDSENENQFLPVDEEWIGRNHRYFHNNMHIGTFFRDTPAHDEIYAVVADYMPEGTDYERVNFMQVIHYSQDNLFPWHRDEADKNDRATAIFMLDEEFTGGRLIVDGHIIMTRRGTMVAFNNSTLRWHSVEPLYNGERHVLALWTGKEQGSKQDPLPYHDEMMEGYK